MLSNRLEPFAVAAVKIQWIQADATVCKQLLAPFRDYESAALTVEFFAACLVAASDYCIGLIRRDSAAHRGPKGPNDQSYPCDRHFVSWFVS
jgi:hypothetical protein